MGGERLYAAGYTYTAYGPQNFFPFTDPVGEEDWFDNVFYPATDGFLAAFCIDGLLTALPESVGRGHGLTVVRTGHDAYAVHGLPPGGHHVQVVDMRGRVIAHKAAAAGTSSIQLSLPGAAQGVYLFAVPGVGVVKVHH